MVINNLCIVCSTIRPRQRRKFCSRDCLKKFYYKNRGNCKICQKDLPKQHKTYCSKNCMAIGYSEERKKNPKYFYGRKHTIETINILSSKRKGKKRSVSEYEKLQLIQRGRLLGQRNIGRKMSYLNKQKTSERTKKLWLNDEYRQKCIFSKENHPSFKKLITKEELYNFYINQKMSIQKIAYLKQCSYETIARRMIWWEIPRRSNSERAMGKYNPMFSKITYKKAKFIQELNHYIRSGWEEKIAYLLKNNNISYEYEGVTLKDTNETYKPDFFIKPNILIEVRGVLFQKNYNKLLKFVKMYGKEYIFCIITDKRQKIRYFNNFPNCYNIFKTKNIKHRYIQSIDEEQKDKFLRWLKLNI